MNATEGHGSSDLTPLHWIGIVLTLVTATVHFVLGIGFLPHWMGVAFVAATVGFLLGIWLVLRDRNRQLVYLLGIPFVIAQILLWYLLNDISSIGDLGVADIVDKTAQVALVIVLVRLYTRDR